MLDSIEGLLRKYDQGTMSRGRVHREPDGTGPQLSTVDQAFSPKR